MIRVPKKMNPNTRQKTTALHSPKSCRPLLATELHVCDPVTPTNSKHCSQHYYVTFIMDQSPQMRALQPGVLPCLRSGPDQPHSPPAAPPDTYTVTLPARRRLTHTSGSQ